MRNCARLLLAIATLCFPLAVSAQASGRDAMEKLAFMAGSWTCVIQGPNVPPGDVEHATYTFSPDWTWMIERSDLTEKGRIYWSAQVWGYDSRQRRLVAYRFSSRGVSTKTVVGWVGGRFKSVSDENGGMVSIQPISKDAFNWIDESANHSWAVTEACKR
jgi:hypothetical protein